MIITIIIHDPTNYVKHTKGVSFGDADDDHLHHHHDDHHHHNHHPQCDQLRSITGGWVFAHITSRVLLLWAVLSPTSTLRNLKSKQTTSCSPEDGDHDVDAEEADEAVLPQPSTISNQTKRHPAEAVLYAAQAQITLKADIFTFWSLFLKTWKDESLPAVFVQRRLSVVLTLCALCSCQSQFPESENYPGYQTSYKYIFLSRLKSKNQLGCDVPEAQNTG